jgi:hypothetical protein
MFSLEELQSVLTPTQYATLKTRLETASKVKHQRQAVRVLRRLLIETGLGKEELKLLVDDVVLPETE